MAITVGEIAVKTLMANNIDQLYCLPGVQNDDFFDVLYDNTKNIKPIHTRHEQGAAYMALGAAMATGKPQVFSIVPGPGFLNSTAALSTAYAVNAPVFALIGQIPLGAIGKGYAAEMIRMARALAQALAKEGAPVFEGAEGHTNSHQFAIKAAAYGGGQAASKTLRKSGFLACGIGLPIDPVEGDMNGLRIGTPELVRWGMTAEDAPRLAQLIARGLTTNDPGALATEVADWRAGFNMLHFINK